MEKDIPVSENQNGFGTLPSLLLTGSLLLPVVVFGSLQSFQSRRAALFWTAGVMVFSLLGWTALRPTRWRAAVGWIALALAGQACSLQLLDVGPLIHLQLFYEWQILLRSYRVVFLVALLLQAAVVAWGTRRLWPALRSGLPRMVSWPAALVFLALEVCAAITIAPGVAQALIHGDFLDQAARHVTKVALALVIYAVGTLSLALAAASLPSDAWETLATRWQKAERRWLPCCCALWVVVISSLLAWFVLDRMPHVPDEAAYVFQAKYLAAGHLYLPPPPDPEAFPCQFCVVDGAKWYSAMLGGWAFMLALGYRLGLPWLVNPLLGGLAILLAHALVRRLYSRTVADAVALLLATSPWLLFMSASFMPHGASLVFALVGLLGLERARRTSSVAGAALSGLSFGALLHIRPLEAVGFALAPGIWWLAAGWKKLRLPALATALATGLIMTSLFLAYNKTLSGNAWLAPVNKYFDMTVYPGANRIGFGRDVGNFGWTAMDALPGHGPIDVAMNTNQNLYMVNFELFGWACGSLVFVFLLLVWRQVRSDGLMWGLLFTLWAAMSLYWFSGGPDFGARYWYLMILPLVVLTVRGAEEWAKRRRAFNSSSPQTHRVWAFFALASLLALLNILPWRSLDKYHNYRTIRPDLRRLEREYKFGRSLVFIRGQLRPDYASAMPLNPPTLDRATPGPIYAFDRGPESRARLREYFADRPVWIVAGPSETKDSFLVLEGPLPPKQPPRNDRTGATP